MAKNNLSVRNFGIAWGILGAISVFLIGILGNVFNWDLTVKIISEWYPGFSTTFIGSIIGAFFGFIDLFVMGILLAWVYNKLNK